MTDSEFYESTAICRICHGEAEEEAPLIAPCYCAGSLQYVHQFCLQQWIKSSNNRNCELCKFQFVMQAKVKPIIEWELLDMPPVEQRRLFFTIALHTIIVACAFWRLYVLSLCSWPFWIKMMVVPVFVIFILVSVYIQGKKYCNFCHRLYAFNRVIQIQDAPEKPPTLPPQLTLKK